MMLRKFGSLALAALFFSYATHVAAQMNDSKRPGVLSLGVAGVATPKANTLSVAAPLANLTNGAVAETRIDRIQLATAPVQTKLPLVVGAIGPRSSVIVQAELNSEFSPQRSTLRTRDARHLSRRSRCRSQIRSAHIRGYATAL